MDNINMLSNTEITRRISEKQKELRLKQNISRQDLSASTEVSVSSIARMEDGEIKSFESFLRILRTLDRIDARPRETSKIRRRYLNSSNAVRS